MTPQRKCDHVEQGKKENKDKEKGEKEGRKIINRSVMIGSLFQG